MPEICFMFFSLGGYHQARLKAAQTVASTLGWQVHTIAISAEDSERPWGRQDSDLDITTLFESFERFSGATSRQVNQKLIKILDSRKPNLLFVPGWGHVTARVMLDWARENRALVCKQTTLARAPRR